MGKNKKTFKKNRGGKNYNLKSDAVEKLTGSDAPEYSEEELNRYRRKRRFRLSDTAKVVFIKAWFAGAVCFFFLWGLGTYINSTIDVLFVLGVALGMVTDLLTNNVLRFIEKSPNQNDKWMMFPRKKNGIFFPEYHLFAGDCDYGLYDV